MGELSYSWTTPEQAKDILKQLRLKRKELVGLKGEVSTLMTQVRAAHRSRVADRGAKFQGGGKFGRFVRRVQTTSRDSDRRSTDKSIQALEVQKAEVDNDIRTIDSMILQVEQWLAENKPERPAPKATRAKEPDVVDQIARLGKLRDSGLLTDQEFEEKKRDLLSRL